MTARTFKVVGEAGGDELMFFFSGDAGKGVDVVVDVAVTFCPDDLYLAHRSLSNEATVSLSKTPSSLNFLISLSASTRLSSCCVTTTEFECDILVVFVDAVLVDFKLWQQQATSNINQRIKNGNPGVSVLASSFLKSNDQ